LARIIDYSDRRVVCQGDISSRLWGEAESFVLPEFDKAFRHLHYFFPVLQRVQPPGGDSLIAVIGACQSAHDVAGGVGILRCFTITKY